MGTPISINQLVDIGFVGLVLFACSKSLFTRGDRMTSRTKQWRDELRALEATLRELIGEATAAGNNLNRSLLKRREELNTLVSKMEGIKADAESFLEDRETVHVEAPVKARPARAAAPKPTATPVKHPHAFEEELPNASWNLPEAKAATRAPISHRATYQQSHFEEAADDNSAESIELDQLIELQEDHVSLSSRPAQRAIPAPKASAKKPNISDLARKLAQLNQERDAEAVTPAPAGIDPTAYRVARRLLASGREIHVVARKLELPIAEVRMIERMMRLERGETGLIDEQDSSTPQPSESNRALMNKQGFSEDDAEEEVPFERMRTYL